MEPNHSELSSAITKSNPLHYFLSRESKTKIHHVGGGGAPCLLDVDVKRMDYREEQLLRSSLRFQHEVMICIHPQCVFSLKFNNIDSVGYTE